MLVKANIVCDDIKKWSLPCISTKMILESTNKTDGSGGTISSLPNEDMKSEYTGRFDLRNRLRKKIVSGLKKDVKRLNKKKVTTGVDWTTAELDELVVELATVDCKGCARLP